MYYMKKMMTMDETITTSTLSVPLCSIPIFPFSPVWVLSTLIRYIIQSSHRDKIQKARVTRKRRRYEKEKIGKRERNGNENPPLGSYQRQLVKPAVDN